MRASPLVPLFLTVFIDLVGFGIVIPVLPYYVRSMGADSELLGLLTASFSLTQFLFSPLLGGLSDRIGRRPVLILSLVGNAAATALMGLAGSVGGLALLFGARVLSGMTAATIGTAQAYIADVTPPEKRAAGMGMLGAAFGLGFVLGPSIGGVLSHRFGYSFPFYAVALLALCNALLAYFNLPEPEKREQRSVPRSRGEAFRQALAEPRVGVPIALFFVTAVAFANLETTIALLTSDRYHMTPEQTGYLFGYMGVMIVLVQGGLVRRLVPRFGEQKLLAVGSLITGTAILLIAVNQLLAVLILALGMAALGQGMVNPSLSSLVSRQAPPEQQGSVMGIMQATGSLGRVFGPALSGFLYGMDKVNRSLPYYVGGTLMLVAAGIAFWYQQRFPPEVTPSQAPSSES